MGNEDEKGKQDAAGRWLYDQVGVRGEYARSKGWTYGGSRMHRGVWYPIANIGFGAPRDREYATLAEESGPFCVWRLDDNGNEFQVREFASRRNAEAYRDELAAKGHKQTYWVRRADA